MLKYKHLFTISGAYVTLLKSMSGSIGLYINTYEMMNLPTNMHMPSVPLSDNMHMHIV